MTFGYIGYIWALLGCSCTGALLAGIGLVLYRVGKRADRGGPRVVVTELRRPDERP